MTPQKFYERPPYRSNDLTSTPKKRAGRNSDREEFNERKFALYGLILSLIIIAAKLYYSNSKFIHDLIIDRRLVSIAQVTKEGKTVFKNVWVDSVKYSKYWFPILCGLLTTYFTWLMVYIDSNVPGIQPPSPLSPSKYKIQSGHSFHLNYVFALLMGILVSGYMFWKGLSLY